MIGSSPINKFCEIQHDTTYLFIIYLTEIIIVNVIIIISSIITCIICGPPTQGRITTKTVTSIREYVFHVSSKLKKNLFFNVSFK